MGRASLPDVTGRDACPTGIYNFLDNKEKVVAEKTLEKVKVLIEQM